MNSLLIGYNIYNNMRNIKVFKKKNHNIYIDIVS